MQYGNDLGTYCGTAVIVVMLAHKEGSDGCTSFE